jgi:hypothetical protein
MKYYYYEVMLDGFDEVGGGEEFLMTAARAAVFDGAYPDGIIEKAHSSSGLITCAFYTQQELIDMHVPDKHERKHEEDCARADYNRLNGE